MSYFASDINKILKDYLNSTEGKKFIKENNISITLYDDAKVREITQKLKDEIINTFLSTTRHASYVDAQDYFSKVNIGKIQHLKSGDKVNINFTGHSLYRPSLVRRNGKQSGGIDDIFALITNGTKPTNKSVYGYWTYFSEGMGYGTEEYWVRGYLPRKAKPFIQAIIKRYEQEYSGLTITYPQEWK